MSWNPIVVGVDGSPESVRAAMFAAMLAERTGTPCRLVHAVPEYWTAVPPELGVDTAALNRAAVEQAHRLITNQLQDELPAPLLGTLDCQVGHASQVLAHEAQRLQASVVIMGAKHHRGVARIAGSAITHLVRLGGIPVLAHVGEPGPIRRVLAAVDLSAAAGPTVAAAETWARSCGAQLRVVHVIEPMPVVPGVTLQIPDDEVFRSARRQVERELRPLIADSGAELVIRRGRSVAGIVTEARDWNASLIVVSSHGKGWMDRLVMGSTSERLLHVVPAPTLILPVSTTTATLDAAHHQAAGQAR